MSASQANDGTSTLTARDLFASDPHELQTLIEVALGEGDLGDSLASAGPGSASRFVMAQAANALDEILGGLELDRILMGAWEQLDDVRATIDETRRDGTTRNLTLASHTVTSEHEPSLELLINQAPKKLLDVLITLGFTIAICDLVIDRGVVTGVELGPLTASGEVIGQNCTIVKRETSELDPTRLFGAMRRPVPPIA